MASTLTEAIARSLGDAQAGVLLTKPRFLCVSAFGKEAPHLIEAQNLRPLCPPITWQGTPVRITHEATFIDASDNLHWLIPALAHERKTNPFDGWIIAISAAQLARLGTAKIGETAASIRTAIIGAQDRLSLQLPVYVVVTEMERLWGFGEAFTWSAERQKEPLWGEVLPPLLPREATQQTLSLTLGALVSRANSHVMARLLGEVPPGFPPRAFSHLAEWDNLKTRAEHFFSRFCEPNSFEGIPWVRMLAVGATQPGFGGQPLDWVDVFDARGLHVGSPSPVSRTPGGIPLFDVMAAAVLPERPLVPERLRWLDDPWTMWPLALGTAMTLASTLGWLFLLLRQFASAP